MMEDKNFDDKQVFVSSDPEKTSTTLSDEAWDKLTSVLENPPAPSDAMKQLMAKEKITNRETIK